MKAFTVKEICEVLEIKEGTFRAWMSKVVEGAVYHKADVNYPEVRKNILAKYENDESYVEKLLGCKLEEFEIVKKERSKADHVSVAKLEEGESYEIRNYSLKYRVCVKKITVIDEDVVYLCRDLEKNEYRIWTAEDLMKQSIRIVELSGHVITIEEQA